MEVSPTIVVGLAPADTAPGARERCASRAAAPAWAWPAAAALIVAASLAPFLVVDTPAVLDYPNHLARFFILAHPDDPILSRMYAPHWAVLPNVGMDVLGRALLGWLAPDVGGRMLLALSLLAPPAGAVLYARAAFGRWTWWSLGAGAVAYNGIFFLGFMNFLLGLGVALAGAAAWQALRRQGRDRTAAAAGGLIALGAFFCHLLGFGFFALLVGAQEVEPVIGAWRRRQRPWRAAGYAATLLTVALAPGAALYVLTHRPVVGGDLLAWNWGAKLMLWLTPFMIYDTAPMVVTAVAVLAVVILVRRHVCFASGARLALALIGALYLLAPLAAGGGTYVDARLPLMGALVLFSGLELRAKPVAGKTVAAVFALLIVGRSAIVAANWVGHARDLAELRAQLAYVAPGARILPASLSEPRGDEPGARVLPRFVEVNDELAALAVIERRAFWPLEFADPAQQPLAVRAPYASMAEPLGRSTPWIELFDAPPTAIDVAEHRYLNDWRRRFDFVLAVGPPLRSRPLPQGLALVRAGEATSLYRVVR